MATKTNSYWVKRFEALENMSNEYAQETYASVEKSFNKAQRKIQAEIDVWYNRIAVNNNISLKDAKKLLNDKELKEFKWDVNEYINYGKQNALNEQWMKELENASAKYHISRLEALKVRTQHELERAFGNELDDIDKMARRVYTEDYYHSAYEIQKGFNIGFNIGEIDDKKLDKLINKPWAADGKNFSNRIWQSKTSMINDLHNELVRTCILGKSPDDAIKKMTKYVDKKFNNAKLQAGRLIMTEQAFFSSAAQKDCFNELDVERYEVVATLDSHTSEICQNLDGQVFPMKDFQPGVTAPPFHVWCRSTTVPYFEDNFGGERAARGLDGKTYFVPDNMTYKEWNEAFVDGNVEGLKEVTEVEPKVKPTIESLSKLGTDAIQKNYEERRISEHLNLSSIKELNDSGIDLVKVDYTGISVETAEVVNDTLTDLFDRYTSRAVSVEVMDGKEAFGITAYASTGHRSVTADCSILLNPNKMSNYEKMCNRIMELSEKGYSVKIPSEKAGKYVITHEFGHSLIDMQSPLKNYVGYDVKKAKKIRKEVESIFEEYKTTVRTLQKNFRDSELEFLNTFSEDSANNARKYKAELETIKISDYSLESSDEFFAEAFTHGELSEEKNVYADRVMKIINDNFRK